MKEMQILTAKKGFSLIELMIGLSLSTFMVLVSLEVFSTSRTHFLGFKEQQEIHQAAAVALSRIRADVQIAGHGLLQAIRQNEASCLEVDNQVLRVLGSETYCSLRLDVKAGDNRILLSEAQKIKAGHRLCLIGRDTAEIRSIISNTSGLCLVSPPFSYSYPASHTQAVQLREISIYLDKRTGTLRRKVNLSSGQPLCEGITMFQAVYDISSNLVTIQMVQKTREDHIHELQLFPKNIGLSR